MASACVKTIGPSHSWHSFPRDSLLPDLNNNNNSPDKTELDDFFEFRLNPTTNTNNILPADQLFFNGKLLTKHSPPPLTTPPEEKPVVVHSPPPVKEAKCGGGGGATRWRDLLGFKNKKSSVKHFLTKKYPKLSTAAEVSSSSSTLTLPLLHRNSDSSLLDLPSSLPPHRFSLDEKPSEREFTRPSIRRIRPKSVSDNPNPILEKPLIDHPTASVVNQIRRGGGVGLSADSPRMNHAGKIVFQGLGRSSSSPSSFNGGNRYMYKGMERSYSANVRVKPVLNVPICSIRGSSSKSGSGFGLSHFFSSSQKKDKDGGSNGGIGSGGGNGNGSGSGSSRHFHLHHKKDASSSL